MSRLAQRLRTLEQRLGNCPSCANRRALIEIVTPNGRRVPATDTDTGPCHACGQPRQQISVVFSFDPYPPQPTKDSDPDTQPAASRETNA